MELIEVKIEQSTNNKQQLKFTFTNNTDKKYFLDEKLAFRGGKYTIDCLSIEDSLGNKVKRKMKLKVRPSVYPEQFIQIEPDESITSIIDISQHFHISVGLYKINYSCFNSEPINAELDEIKSEKSLTISI